MTTQEQDYRTVVRLRLRQSTLEAAKRQCNEDEGLTAFVTRLIEKDGRNNETV